MKFTAEFDSIEEIFDFVDKLKRKEPDKLLEFLIEQRQTQKPQEIEGPVHPVESVEETPVAEAEDTVDSVVPEQAQTLSMSETGYSNEAIQQLLELWWQKHPNEVVRPKDITEIIKEVKDLRYMVRNLKNSQGFRKIGSFLTELSQGDNRPYQITIVMVGTGRQFRLTQGPKEVKPITRKLTPLSASDQDLEKFLDVWSTRYGSRERNTIQLVALAKEYNLFRDSSLWSNNPRVRSVFLGRLLSRYSRDRVEHKYFVRKENVPIRKNGLPTSETRYNLIPNEKYTNGLNPKKVVLTTTTAIPNFPTKWLHLVESHVKQGTSFTISQVMDSTEDMQVRLNFNAYLRTHPKLRWNIDKGIYEVVKTEAEVN